MNLSTLFNLDIFLEVSDWRSYLEALKQDYHCHQCNNCLSSKTTKVFLLVDGTGTESTVNNYNRNSNLQNDIKTGHFFLT